LSLIIEQRIRMNKNRIMIELKPEHYKLKEPLKEVYIYHNPYAKKNAFKMFYNDEIPFPVDLDKLPKKKGYKIKPENILDIRYKLTDLSIELTYEYK
jgi:hypothetical protein